MNIATLIQIIKALPLLIKVIYELWEAIKRLSNGRPEQLLTEIYDIHLELKNDKADRKLLANRISMLWSGMPDKTSKET
jgi:hypothetical protein